MLTLERILQSQGFGTRKSCRHLIRSRQVTVNGISCEDPFAEFAPDGLEFTVRGENWIYREQVYLMLNKPAGYECSHRSIHHPSVFTLLPPPLQERGVQCVGRLDEDTTGLLLFSDDGQFIHRMSSPRHKVPKVYAVTVKHEVEADLAQRLLAGVQLRDEPEPIAALACEILSSQVLRLTIAEGKYHQVKRMVSAAGNRVAALRRIAVGGLQLPDDLAEGAWRWLDAGNLASLPG